MLSLAYTYELSIHKQHLLLALYLQQKAMLYLQWCLSIIIFFIIQIGVDFKINTAWLQNTSIKKPFIQG